MELTATNYQKGMLVDDEWLAGVSEADSGQFAAFVFDQSTGDLIGHSLFPTLDEALVSLARMPRSWKYEPVSACGTGQCGEGAQCGTGLCPKQGGSHPSCG